MRKKFLALFLALCLGCSLLPSPALAVVEVAVGSTEYENLKSFLLTFYRGFGWGSQYDSSIATINSRYGENLLQSMLSPMTSYHDGWYPGEAEKCQIGVNGLDKNNAVPDPLGKYGYYSKTNASKVDWILKNIFNCTDEEIVALKQPILTGKDPSRYYLDGYYYHEAGDIGDMTDISILSLEKSGENYLVKFRTIPYYDAPESDAEYYYSVVQLKKIDGKEYWSLYYLAEIQKNQNPTRTGGFLDVDSDAYYYEPMMWAVNKEITSGTGWTTFSPNAACTRGQTVMFLWNAAGKPTPSRTSSPFVDVKNSDYYFNAVLWAVEKGIVSGTDATHFNPGKTCTRAEAVTFLWRTYGEGKTSDVRYFNDVSSGSWYKDAVNWSVENGLTTGTGGTSFSPDKSCTRGQIVTFLYRTLEGGLPESQRPEALPALPDWNSTYRDFVLNGKYKSSQYKYIDYYELDDKGNSSPVTYEEEGMSPFSTDEPIRASLRDMDADGTPELFLTNGGTGNYEKNTYIYTIVDVGIIYLGNGPSQTPYCPAAAAQFSGVWGSWGGPWSDGERITYYKKSGNQIIDEEVSVDGRRVTSNVALFNASDLSKMSFLYSKTINEIKSMGWDAFVRETGV